MPRFFPRCVVAMCLLIAVAIPSSAHAQKFDQPDKFRQLDELLPTPNMFRTASGAPGPMYWQQRADYVIEATLDDENQRLTGTETVTYHNNSPDPLEYLWLQLDRNMFTPGSDARLTQTLRSVTYRREEPDEDAHLDDTFKELNKLSFEALKRLVARETFDGGYKITRVESKDGKPLDFTVVKTMMRIDLPVALKPGASISFSIDWNFNINDSAILNSRTAAEYFEDDDNWIYEMAHWFPRMAAYTDYAGWQHKQFLGSGEFTLEFGDYEVALTVPSDHIVASTGSLQNPKAEIGRAHV